jgi:hypothetical protein
VSEVLAALTVLLAPAGIMLGWLAVLAVIVAALSGAASGVRLVNPPPDPTASGSSVASSR